MKTEQIFSSDNSTLLDVQNQGMISIAQLRHQSVNTLDYISVHRAFYENLLKIEEVSESGNVNELLLTNLSSKYIFIMDGDILKGAKQNRIVNASILIGPNVKMVIPVSCVEQGRWAYDSNNFSGSDEVAYRKIREQKNRDIYNNRNYAREKHRVNQSRVWDEVQNCFADSQSYSSTASHSDNFNAKRMDYTSMTSSFTLHDNANGLAYFINGNLCGVEVFNKTDVYREYFHKILLSVAMDAEIIMRKFEYLNRADLSMDHARLSIEDTLNDFKENLNRIDICNGICLGKEFRLITDKEIFYNLSFNEQPVHQSILSFEKDGSDNRNNRPNRPTEPMDSSEIRGRSRHSRLSRFFRAEE